MTIIVNKGSLRNMATNIASFAPKVHRASELLFCKQKKGHKYKQKILQNTTTNTVSWAPEVQLPCGSLRGCHAKAADYRHPPNLTQVKIQNYACVYKFSSDSKYKYSLMFNRSLPKISNTYSCDL